MKVESAMAADFFSKLSAARNIVIAGHLNPDGDCIGCLTGMKAWIESAFRGSVESISMIVPNVFPDYLKFMPGASQVLDFSLNPSAAEALIEKADTVICMDLNNLARTEGMAEALRLNAGQKVLIDHHPQPEDFADLVFSETEVSSAPTTSAKAHAARAFSTLCSPGTPRWICILSFPRTLRSNSGHPISS